MYPLHLLLALAQEKEGIVRPVLEKCGVHPDAIVSEATSLIGITGKLELLVGGAAQVDAALNTLKAAGVKV